MTPQLLVSDLGTKPYADALAIQRAAARARISGEFADDLLILVEHPPVITLGRRSKQEHLLATPELLASRGIELHEVERGGDVTFHGPGQLVGYPIMDLKRHKQDLHWYLRRVEEALMEAMRTFGLETGRSEGQTGVWTHGRKIASIGVHARDWVTWHGFALNVSTDLSFFDLMVPCGIAQVQMTSVAAELELSDSRASDQQRGRPERSEGPAWTSSAEKSDPLTVVQDDSRLGALVRDAVIAAFSRVFSLEPATLDPAELERVAAATVTP